MRRRVGLVIAVLGAILFVAFAFLLLKTFLTRAAGCAGRFGDMPYVEADIPFDVIPSQTAPLFTDDAYDAVFPYLIEP